MKFIDKILDSITMYRVALYGLTGLAIYSIILSASGLLFYSVVSLLETFAIVNGAAIATHYLFKTVYKAPANVESSFITAFILYFIVIPPSTYMEAIGLAMVAFIAVASKYLIAYRNRHIFNPVAFALVLGGILNFTGPIWWAGSLYMLPGVLIVGLLLIKKIKRFSLFLTYILVSAITVLVTSFTSGSAPIDMLMQFFVSGPAIFFACIMLTEPFTTPPTRKLQMIYASLVGIISAIPFHIGILYNTPEFALLLGNIFSYSVSLRARLFLLFKEKREIAKDTFEFIFERNIPLSHHAGQYMEWTLPHAHPDVRGIRRYFTIASSPLDQAVRLGVKFPPEGMQRSTFKTTLFNLVAGDHINATAVAGDFVLPHDPAQAMVFIAGGIGVTPFTSMLRYLIDNNEKRNITLFYCNKSISDIAYTDVLAKASEKVGLTTVEVISDKESLPEGWVGETGFVTVPMIAKYVPDWKTRIYYISGPPAMVGSYSLLLSDAGIPHTNIITDYFPGFA